MFQLQLGFCLNVYNATTINHGGLEYMGCVLYLEILSQKLNIGHFWSWIDCRVIKNN